MKVRGDRRTRDSAPANDCSVSVCARALASKKANGHIIIVMEARCWRLAPAVLLLLSLLFTGESSFLFKNVRSYYTGARARAIARFITEFQVRAGW